MPPSYPLLLLLPLILHPRLTHAAAKTHIYIDQVPLYASLAPCAVDRVSQIVRNQASGCGDDTQLTSFACFCIDSSREFASIIATAVADQCERAATATQTLTTAAPGAAAVAGRLRRVRRDGAVVVPTPTDVAAADVSSALEVFGSYCAKSTELTRLNDPITTYPITPDQLTITIAPSGLPTSTATTSPVPSPSTNPHIPLAVILLPIILIPPLVIAPLLFLLLHHRHRRIQSQRPKIYEAPTGDAHSKRELPPVSAVRRELACDCEGRKELAGGSRRDVGVHELGVGVPAVELDGGMVGRRGEGSKEMGEAWDGKDT